MKFRESRKEETGIDLTPFIDVVFMLLLFFVVSANFYKGANKLDVALPEANAPSHIDKQKTLELGVDAKGDYFVDGQAVGGNERRKLKALLAKRIKDKNMTSLLLAGDSQAPYQSVVTAMDVASELNLNEINIVTKPVRNG